MEEIGLNSVAALSRLRSERNNKMEINPKAPLVTRREIFIQASPEIVWKLQTEINEWKNWQPGVTRSELMGKLAPGSAFQWTSGGFAVTSTLQEVVPGQRISWTGKAFGSRARHLWTFKLERGGTLVLSEESMEGWLVVLLKPLMPGFLEKALDARLKNLKTKAEEIQNKSL